MTQGTERLSPFAVNEPEALSELLTTHLSLLVTGIPEEASGPQNRGRREMGGRLLRRGAQGSDSSHPCPGRRSRQARQG